MNVFYLGGLRYKLSINIGIGIGDSETGAFESDTRTSRNTWLRRSSSVVMDTLFRRAADILQVDEKHLTKKTGAEDLQVLHLKYLR